MSSDETPLPDWKALWERSEANRKRSRKALVISIVGLALVVGALIGVGLFAASFRDVPELQRKQAATLTQSVNQTRKLNEVLGQLQTAEAQRQCSSAQTALAFASILDLLGNAFGTPPAPDPERQRAVAGFHAAAESFRHAPPATTTC